MSDFLPSFFNLVQRSISELSDARIEQMVAILHDLQRLGGRLFVMGVGGSAANASHACADFRNLCEIEAYCPTDNVAGLTAWINDEGWEGSFAAWLTASRICERDAALVLSVGGGDKERSISTNLIAAIDTARMAGAATMAIVGRNGGYATGVCDTVLLAGPPSMEYITPIAESLQSLVLHSLVFHPCLRRRAGKWEGLLQPVKIQRSGD